ncbi:MAG: VCBS repeat-containing protein [Planctomycetes bacterium]|nr:VCBS repeat-containing protein [Planctomycetota bacterium]
MINGGNVVIADLEKDGWNDVIIADVDVDIAGCNHRTFVFHNQGNAPTVTFVEEDQVIPDAELFGVYDIAAMDIDGDGWLDLVLGKCDGTTIWMNVPPADLAFTYPGGVPDEAAPNVATPIDVRIDGVGAGLPVPGSERQHVSVGGGPFVETALDDLGAGLHRATLPAVACPGVVRFYVSADLTTGGSRVDPPGAPGVTRQVLVADALTVALDESFEGDVSSWTVESDPSLTAGAWERAQPNATSSGGAFAAPPADATPGLFNLRAFVTDNGPPGGSELANDVDGGPTHLVSPLLDLAGTDAEINYSRWFFSDLGVPDTLTVEITATGGEPWIAVPEHVTTGTGGAWETVSLVVSDHVTPSSSVRVRFTTGDTPNDSVTEAGIDDFLVRVLGCAACPEDLDDSGAVGFSDVLAVIGAWGPCPPECPQDLSGNGVVDFADILEVIGAWGPCS